MSTRRRNPETRSERVLFTLPGDLLRDLEKYAEAVRQGNKSGFVADAVRFYINSFRKRRHTQLLRQSYAQAAEQSRQVNQEWESLDDEAWARLDELTKQSKDAS